MTKNTPSISVIILQGGKYDKEVFRKSLQSVSFADEIIKLEADKLKGSFSDFRNLGAKKAKNKWILYVDTDEIVTPELQESISRVIATDNYSAYAIPRKNIVLGQEMRHCGLWPDYVLRLINKQKFSGWEGKLHEETKITGKIGYLKEALIHQKHDNIADMVDKTNKWSEIEAEIMFKAHHPPMNFFRFASAGFREFWLRMVVQAAFLDGVKGTIYGLYQVFSRLISYSKLWEMQIKNEGSNS